MRFYCFLVWSGSSHPSRGSPSPALTTELPWRLQSVAALCSIVCVLVTQLCLTLCDSTDCSPPCPSVHGLLQAGILEWVSMPFSRGSSRPRDRSWVSHIVGRFVTIWANRGALTFSKIYCSCCLYQKIFFHSSMSFLVLWYPFHYIIHSFLPILVKCPLKSSRLINLHCLFTSWKPSPMVLLPTFVISEGFGVLPVQFHTGVPVFAVFSVIPVTLCEETTSCLHVNTILFFKGAFLCLNQEGRWKCCRFFG